MSSYQEAVALITRITDLDMGILQYVVEGFAKGGHPKMASLISSIVGQEGEQTGWFRQSQGEIPSELPFLTVTSLSNAFSADQQYIVPGSCPNKKTIPLRTFSPLHILTPPGPWTRNITVSFSGNQSSSGSSGSSSSSSGNSGNSSGNFWMTYSHQHKRPITVPLHMQQSSGGMMKGMALFPYDKHLLNGFTVADVTKGSGPFPDINAVAQSTVAGPGLIVVN